MIDGFQSFHEPLLRVGRIEHLAHCLVLTYEDAALRVRIGVPSVDADSLKTFYADEDRQYPSEARRDGQFHQVPPRGDSGRPFALLRLYMRGRHRVGKSAVSVLKRVAEVLAVNE